MIPVVTVEIGIVRSILDECDEDELENDGVEPAVIILKTKMKHIHSQEIKHEIGTTFTPEEIEAAKQLIVKRLNTTSSGTTGESIGGTK